MRKEERIKDEKDMENKGYDLIGKEGKQTVTDYFQPCY